MLLPKKRIQESEFSTSCIPSFILFSPSCSAYCVPNVSAET